jgi:hypothetical protein
LNLCRCDAHEVADLYIGIAKQTKAKQSTANQNTARHNKAKHGNAKQNTSKQRPMNPESEAGDLP